MTQSKQDQSGFSHGHGWGIVTYDNQSTEDRQAWAAYHSEHFKRSAAKVYANLVLAHVRRATVGKPAIENTHPFKYKHWAFAHNGTVPSFELVKPLILDAMDNHHRKLIRGQTDSEHLFHYALSLLKANPEEDLEGIVRRVVIDVLGWIDQVGANGTPGLNLVLTDGKFLAGSRLGRTLFHVTRSGVYDCEICGYPHILHETNTNHRAVVVASEPLTHELWFEFPQQCTWQIHRNAQLTIDERPFVQSFAIRYFATGIT